MASIRAKRRLYSSHAFTEDEDEYIIVLKEKDRLSWVEISEMFNKRFAHHRNGGALQARYSRYLQPSKRGQAIKSSSESESESDNDITQADSVVAERLSEESSPSSERSAKRNGCTVQYKNRSRRTRAQRRS